MVKVSIEERYERLTQADRQRMINTFRSLNRRARDEIRELQNTEKNYMYGKKYHMVILLDAAGILKAGGMDINQISWIVGNSARSIVKNIEDEMYAPDEPNKGGAPADFWIERSSLLRKAMAEARAQKGGRGPNYKQAIRIFRKLLADDECDGFGDVFNADPERLVPFGTGKNHRQALRTLTSIANNTKDREVYIDKKILNRMRYEAEELERHRIEMESEFEDLTDEFDS